MNNIKELLKQGTVIKEYATNRTQTVISSDVYTLLEVHYDSDDFIISDDFIMMRYRKGTGWQRIIFSDRACQLCLESGRWCIVDEKMEEGK